MPVVPTFGDKQDRDYVDRFGAYIIIARNNDQEVLLVQALNGAYFLPGGEIEGQETKEEAIHREVMEELGFTVIIETYLGQADDYFYSRHRQTYYHHPAYFYAAASWVAQCAPLEDFNRLEWLALDEAEAALKRGSHKWALQQWRTQKQAAPTPL